MHVLVVTNMYPTPAVPNAGPFVAAQVESLRRTGVEVDVLHFPRHQLGRKVYRALGRTVEQRVATADPDLVHVAYGGVMAEVVTRVIRDRPVLVTFHGTDLLAGRANGVVDALALRLGVWASHRAARRAAGIIVVSPNVAAALPGSLDASRVWIVPNGVDLSMFRPRDRAECRRTLGWDPARAHVVFPASPARPEKRFDLARATVAVLEGGGTPVDLHPLDGVPHDDVPLWLSGANAILLTSVHEGSPVVVKEALACNVPVVSVDVGDVRTRIEGIEGCAIAEPTPADLAEKLQQALEHGPIEGRDRIAELSLERVADRVRGIYATLADGTGERLREPA